MTRVILMSLLAMPLLFTGLRAAEKAVGEGANDLKTQKREQMRALTAEIRTQEAQALKKNADLKAKLAELEKQRRALMIEANPGLVDLYADLDELQKKNQTRAQKGGRQEGRQAKKGAAKGKGKAKDKDKDADADAGPDEDGDKDAGHAEGDD